MTKRLTVELTDMEIHVLAHVIDNELRDKQGDGSMSDEADDALVSLNDKLEAAIREVSP